MGFLRITLLNIVLLLFIAGCSVALHISEFYEDKDAYPMFGKTPARDFTFPVEIGDSLKSIWVAETKGSFTNTSFTLSKNYLFASDLSGRITCFDAKTGKELGIIEAKGDVSVTPVIYFNKIIYVLNYRNENYSSFIIYDIGLGKINIDKRLAGGCANELLLTGNAVYILTDIGNLYSFNLVGNQNWVVKTKAITLTDPLFFRAEVWFANSEGDLISIDSSGKIKNNVSLSVNSVFEGSLTADDNYVYLADNKGKVYCFDPAETKIKWTSETGGYNILSCPVLKDSYLFVGNLRGELICLDKQTGSEIWSSGLGGMLNTTPAVFNDFLLQPDNDKTLWFIDYKTGKTVKKMKFDGKLKTIPVYKDGTLFIGYDRGIIEAFNVTDKD